MRFPTIKQVARELRDINAWVEGSCDVRLQVYPDGSWAIRSGLSDYDQDHRGFWGASSVPGCENGRKHRFNSVDLARDLLEQAQDQYAEAKLMGDLD